MTRLTMTRAVVAHAVTWAAWGLLLLQQLGDLIWYGKPWIFYIGQLMPLLIFVPGMLRDRPRSFIWLCFVSLLYFIALVQRQFVVFGAAEPGAVGPVDRLMAAGGMVAVVALFIAAMLYVRWRNR